MAILGSEGGNKHEISMLNKMITSITWILFICRLILLVIISSFSTSSKKISVLFYYYCKKLLKIKWTFICMLFLSIFIVMSLIIKTRGFFFLINANSLLSLNYFGIHGWKMNFKSLRSLEMPLSKQS